MPDSPYYRSSQLVQLQDGYFNVNPAYERLMREYLFLRLTNQAAYEYVSHGFIRRLGTLKRCIENVYSIYPPERSDKPSRNECVDLAINLQSFIFNVFGCIDNLAWIWVKEKGLHDKKGRPLQGQQVGLGVGCIKVRQSFSAEFPFCQPEFHEVWISANAIALHDSRGERLPVRPGAASQFFD